MKQGFKVCVSLYRGFLLCIFMLCVFLCMWFWEDLIVLIYGKSLRQSVKCFVCFPFCHIMATLPSKLPSANVSCHRPLIYLRALFIDTCTSTDHTPPRPPSASPCFSSSTAPHLHLFMEKVTLATWPAIWRGPGGYPKQAKHNPITPQGDMPHLLNSAWVIFCSSLATCKEPLTCLWWAGK